jgi:hypothetical protein
VLLNSYVVEITNHGLFCQGRGRGFESLRPLQKSQENSQLLRGSGEDVAASKCLNKPRTVPKRGAGLGTARAKGSQKVPDEGPPHKKRRPGRSFGERAGPKSKSSKHNENNKDQSAEQGVERRRLTLTHGQEAAGFIEQLGKQFTASAIDGRRLGIFTSLKAAANAISDAFTRGGGP